MDRDMPGRNKRCVTLHYAAMGRNTETGRVHKFVVVNKQMINLDTALCISGVIETLSTLLTTVFFKTQSFGSLHKPLECRFSIHHLRCGHSYVIVHSQIKLILHGRWVPSTCI